MKKVVSTIVLAIVLAGVITSCVKDDEKVYDESDNYLQ